MDIVITTRSGSLEKIDAELEIITSPEGSPGLESVSEFALIDPEGGPPPIHRGASINGRNEGGR